ncbi:uncharacterized protein [Paramormyrops kingsleyae]|uniref:uncharacterized protein isoform X2 n=1 Tax=Paramormyrops kingsleyae TaxID=1676925 RepID=UPI003B96FF5C
MQEGQVYRHTRMCLDSEEEDPDWVFEESLLDQDHHVAVGLGKMEQSAGSVAHVHKMVFRRTAVQQTQMTKGGVHSLKSNKQDSVTQGSWAPVFVTELRSALVGLPDSPCNPSQPPSCPSSPRSSSS